MSLPWEGWPACLCGCGVENLKLQATKLSGDDIFHVKGCACVRHRNRRNQQKGKDAQAKTHRNLGGTGFTPANEESARPYELLVMPEVKTGQAKGSQIPASWDSFIKTEWFRRALDQAIRAVPVGSGARPCVVIRGDFAIVDIRKSPA